MEMVSTRQSWGLLVILTSPFSILFREARFSVWRWLFSEIIREYCAGNISNVSCPCIISRLCRNLDKEEWNYINQLRLPPELNVTVLPEICQIFLIRVLNLDIAINFSDFTQNREPINSEWFIHPHAWIAALKGQEHANIISVIPYVRVISVRDLESTTTSEMILRWW